MDHENGTPGQDASYPWDQLASDEESFSERPWMEMQEAHDHTGNVQDKIRLFLIDDDDPGERFSSSLQNVRDFCGGQTLVDLRAKTVGKLPRNTILEDRARDHTICWGHDMTPMAADTLYEYLRLDAGFGRRLLHIKNATGYDIHAIIGAARLHEIPALRRTIPNYIAQDSFIGVRISAEKQPIFTMRLDLTCPVWGKRVMTCRNCIRERHQGWKGLEPRKLTPLPSFSNSSQATTPAACIMLASTSFLIIGKRANRWTAYSLIDTKPRGSCPLCSPPDPDTAEEDAEDDDVNRYPLDPLTNDKCTTEELAKLRPRQYFLRVGKYRVQVVCEEWKNTLGWLRRRLDDYIKKHPLHLHNERLGSQSQKLVRDKRIRVTYNWIIDHLHMLGELQSVLSDSICSWDQFSRHDQSYFNHLVRHEAQDLRAIGEHFEEMRDVLRHLQDLIARCGEEKIKFDQYLTLAAHERGRSQEWYTVVTFLVGAIAALFIPPTLVASILNVPGEIVPGLRPELGSFMGSCAIMMVMVGALFSLLLYAKQTWNLVRFLILLVLPSSVQNVISTQTWRKVQRWIGFAISDDLNESSAGVERAGTFDDSDIPLSDI